VAEGPIPNSWKEATPTVIWVVLVLAFGFVFAESIGSLFQNPLYRAVFAFIAMVGLVAMLIYRAWLVNRFRTLSGGSILAAIIALLMVLTAAPFVQERKWPVLPFFTNQITPAAPIGFSQQQVDEQIAAATKQLKAQLDQANKDAGLRRQGALLQSDVPVSVEKLPTSLRLLFKGDDIEEIEAKNVVWTKLLAWREPPALFANRFPVWTIILVFKKPIEFKKIYVEDHGAGFPQAEVTINPRYAVVQFTSTIYVTGLVDITADNERSK
jgi:hypothetical protein